MTLNEFLIDKKIKEEQHTEFIEGQGNKGKVLIALIGNKKYVVHASINNFKRFKDWVGLETIMDMRHTGKFYITEYGILPTINIDVEVIITKKKTLYKDDVF